jgi:hypothetical protein
MNKYQSSNQIKEICSSKTNIYLHTNVKIIQAINKINLPMKNVLQTIIYLHAKKKIIHQLNKNQCLWCDSEKKERKTH